MVINGPKNNVDASSKRLDVSNEWHDVKILEKSFEGCPILSRWAFPSS